MFGWFGNSRTVPSNRILHTFSTVWKKTGLFGKAMIFGEHNLRTVLETGNYERFWKLCLETYDDMKGRRRPFGEKKFCTVLEIFGTMGYENNLRTVLEASCFRYFDFSEKKEGCQIHFWRVKTHTKIRKFP